MNGGQRQTKLIGLYGQKIGSGMAMNGNGNNTRNDNKAGKCFGSRQKYVHHKTAMVCILNEDFL